MRTLNRYLSLSVAIVLVVLSVATVWLRLWVVRLSYNIGQAELSLRNVGQQVELLQLEVAKLKSPERLEKLAREKFSLRPPRQEQIVYLQDSFPTLPLEEPALVWNLGNDGGRLSEGRSQATQ